MIGSSMTNKNKNYYPVQTELLFEQSSGSGLGVCKVDKALSGLNRRLYRQNRVYRVKVDVTGDKSQVVDVFRLRNTFMLQRGYQEAMKAWEESFQLAEDRVKDTSLARWRDFRIDLTAHVGDSEHPAKNLRSTGTGTSLQNLVIDSYGPSSSFKPDGTQMDFGIKSDPNTFDIITEYNKMGKVSTSPSGATTEAAYEELSAELNDAEVAALQTEGSQPPYDADDLHPLDVLEYVGTVYLEGDVGTQKLSTGYFDAPLGAVYLRGTFGTVSSIDSGTRNIMKISVQKGDYKGVAAHDFVEVPTME